MACINIYMQTRVCVPAPPAGPPGEPGVFSTGSGTCKKLTGFSMGRVFTVPKCPYTASVSGQ